MTTYLPVDSKQFAVYHTVYTDSNISASFDWNEQINMFLPACNGVFIYRDKQLIGGFTVTENRVSSPFMVPPFIDKERYWGTVLQYMAQVGGYNELHRDEISEPNSQILTQLYGAILKYSNRRMLRPTEACTYNLNEAFCFCSLTEKDIPEIVQTIYLAHASGYTSMVSAPDTGKIHSAVKQRFVSFKQTDTLFMGNMVRSKYDQELAGVCIAGIYPDSPNRFATIHQVSVRPEYRRKGIAKAMMLKSIHDAHTMAPVITLGVLVGNPSEILYRQLGFASGPNYSALVYNIKDAN